MARTTHRALTCLIACLVTCLVTGLVVGHPAYAAAPAPRAAAAFHHVTWLTELGSFSVDAPSGWRVTRPAERTGRVTSQDGLQRLSLTDLDGSATVAAALAARTAAITDLDDVEVLGTGRRALTPTTGGYAGGTLSIGSLAYRWRDPSGRTRLVLTRIIGLDVQQYGRPRAFYELTASGPLGSAAALRRIVRATTPTVFSTP